MLFSDLCFRCNTTSPISSKFGKVVKPQNPHRDCFKICKETPKETIFPRKFYLTRFLSSFVTMTIQEVKEKLKTSSGPVARALHQGHGFKVLVMGFNKGMILKDHKAHIKSKLTVLEGAVIYREAAREVSLERYGEVGIPVEVTHGVEALEDSICLLTQGE